MKKEKLAVIGSGISGISASFFLSKKYDVYLFEKNNYLGGHTRTKSVKENNNYYDIDTGFIVFNNQNYPDLIKFFEYLKIDIGVSNMSFSISIKEPELEYGSHLKSMFAQKKNLFSLSFWLLIKDIIKIYKCCKKIQLSQDVEKYTIDEFLTNHGYSDFIKNYHIYPMISSIWSCDKNKVKSFPLISFVNFFNNHSLFNFFNRPQWKFVKGGSHQYIKKIISNNFFNNETNKEIKKILRIDNKITLIFNNGEQLVVDKIVLATHADQALNLLDNPSSKETEILSKFNYSKNYAYLHSDDKFMPKRKKTWSSWNFIGQNFNEETFSVTYWMNLLQNLNTKNNYFVSINPFEIPNNFYDETIFEHPVFDLETLLAQKRINEIQGDMNTWYCGSYCGYGFHEDGIQSAAYISNLLGVNLPWDRSSNFNNRLQFEI